ncbi:putative sulfate exporter family transporter [Carboxylicivirga sediminis]|uniref:Sulfate exporter family transporter n=1 Tax=Carboxylicivirga sediminis TaxID=2006564 RepID=A0A941IYE0_9BACT|nr:putative sulfate exporter family transporter [Carboxylicivirga sediminis]MBR8537781.1 putative sulfate exporter family transporter [Carboxylicivirga sediminis]
MKTEQNTFRWVYIALAGACFLPFVSPAMALGAGIIISLLGYSPKNAHQYTSVILQASIVLMGFGMNLNEVIAASKNGFIETFVSVILVMALGLLLGRLLKVEKNITLLIAAGTAICGGSAIAAVSPILKSKDYQNSFALIVVFVLNAVALLVFPFIGHQLNLSQEVFGNWAAIAIHDTSSVVGAGAEYGEQALQIATTVKLIRALWIIPLSIVIALLNKNQNTRKVAVPWFILLFVAAIVFAWLFPDYTQSYGHLNWLGKRGMVLALLLIGSNISIRQIKQSGTKSFVLGLTLWIITGVVSLIALNH